MKYKFAIGSLAAILLMTFPNFNAEAAQKPSISWISKMPAKSKNCYGSGYCVSVQVDPTWIRKCLDGGGDDVSVEVIYLNSKGKMIRTGWDPRGKEIKGSLVHFPDANRSVFDSYGQERPIKFKTARVNSIVCVSY